jgi:hypothetical protein
MPRVGRVHPSRMGLLTTPPASRFQRLLGALRPGRRADALSPGIEALLRGQPRVEPPDGLRYRVLSAYERGVRPTRLPRAVAPAWVGALSAAAVVLAFLPALSGGGEPETVASAKAPLRIRVVDDPSLGMGTPGTQPRFSLPPFDDDVIEGP